MALVMSDLGCDLILGTLFVATAVQNLVLKLFATDVTPGKHSVVGDFTEAAGGGYAAITLTRGAGWTITIANDPSDAIYTASAFVFTGALTTNPAIFGYYVTNAAGTVLLWAEKLVASYTPVNNGDTLTITPKIQVSFGTPAA